MSASEKLCTCKLHLCVALVVLKAGHSPNTKSHPFVNHSSDCTFFVAFGVSYLSVSLCSASHRFSARGLIVCISVATDQFRVLPASLILLWFLLLKIVYVCVQAE